jgi:hypothetical protein
MFELWPATNICSYTCQGRADGGPRHSHEAWPFDRERASLGLQDRFQRRAEQVHPAENPRKAVDPMQDSYAAFTSS